MNWLIYMEILISLLYCFLQFQFFWGNFFFIKQKSFCISHQLFFLGKREVADSTKKSFVLFQVRICHCCDNNWQHWGRCYSARPRLCGLPSQVQGHCLSAVQGGGAWCSRYTGQQGEPISVWMTDWNIKKLTIWCMFTASVLLWNLMWWLIDGVLSALRSLGRQVVFTIQTYQADQLRKSFICTAVAWNHFHNWGMRHYLLQVSVTWRLGGGFDCDPIPTGFTTQPSSHPSCPICTTTTTTVTPVSRAGLQQQMCFMIVWRSLFRNTSPDESVLSQKVFSLQFSPTSWAALSWDKQ